MGGPDPSLDNDAPVTNEPETAKRPVVALREVTALPLDAVGAKARNLGRLLEAGLRVPAGFVVTTGAWHAARPDLSHLADLRRENLADVSNQLQRAIELPTQLSDAVAQGLARLGDGPVAVRSAALDEDLPGASAAGIFHTALGVSGTPAVLEAIRDCWRSLFAPEALAYLLDQGGTNRRAMSVLVQRLVEPRFAGVLFTRTPTEELLVEAVRGSGQALVDGRSDPVPLAELPAVLQEELTGLASRVERVVTSQDGLDVEWAWNDEGLWVLQARPITRAVPGGEGRVRWTAANTQEALQDPVTPLTWSLLSPLVEAGRKDLFDAAGFEDIPGPGYMKLFYGVPYFNPDYFRRFLRQIPGAPENIFDVLIFGEGEESGIDFQVPDFTRHTFMMILRLILARLAARERFELFRWRFDRKLRRLTRRPLRDLTDQELLDVRYDATVLVEKALRRHVLGTAIAGGSYLLLELFLRGLAQSDSAGLTSRLASGASGNALAEASWRLEDLARRIADQEDPELLDRIEDELSRGAQSASKLGREFRRFLRDYGHRCEKEAELSEPRWADDPRVLLGVLRSYVSAAEGIGEGLARLREREKTLAHRSRQLADRVSRRLAKRSRLERLLPYRRLLFRYLLREARRYAPYRENLKDQALRALHLIRRVFLEMGNRLRSAGVFEQVSDVFYLDVERVESALTGTVDTASLGRRIASARSERTEHLAGPPPRHVIEIPGRNIHPIYVDQEPGRLLEGAGVSAGKVRGVARVLKGLEDAHRLAPGEILVARVINSGWTPLFHLAGAIVAEVGGVLSHGAIVAREYGIPAVFGAAGASRIRDGALILVDGDFGIVTVED